MDPQTTKFRNFAIVLLVLSAIAFVTNPTVWLWANPSPSPTLQLLGKIADHAFRGGVIVAFGFSIAMLAAYFVRRPTRTNIYNHED